MPNPNKNPDGTFASGGGDQTGSGDKDLGDTKDTKDTNDTDKTVAPLDTQKSQTKDPDTGKDKDQSQVWNKHVYSVQPESREAFDKYVTEMKSGTKPKPSEITKNKKIEKKVIDGINEHIQKWSGHVVTGVETQGSFAKGTDLAGSSDLDIFVKFAKTSGTKEEQVAEIGKRAEELGEKVGKPMADEGTYKLMQGADKKYPEFYVDGAEVQIIGIADVSLEEAIDADKRITEQDRSPHHTAYMKKALAGKEDEVRTLKRFFKDTGVYDASQKSQGFSGFSTEVLVDNLGSFEKTLETFANFEKGSTLGNYTGTGAKTPITIADPIDPSRNLADAFSHSEGTMSVSPNKNLARLIKVSQAMLEKGEMPKITKTEMPSVSLEFNIPDEWGDVNKVAGQLQHVAGKLRKSLEKDDFKIKAPKEQVAKDFEVEVPRINVNHDEETGNVSIDFGFDNFDRDAGKTETFDTSKIKDPNQKENAIKKFKEKHPDAKEKDGVLTYSVEREGNVQAHLETILKTKLNDLGLGKMSENMKEVKVTKGNKEYENLTDKPKGGESFLNTFDFEDIEDGSVIDETKPRAKESKPCNVCNFGDFVNVQMECLKLKAKEGQSYGLLYDQPKVEGRKIKGTLAYAGVSLNNRLYLPEELQKGDGMTVPLILNHASTAGAEEELDRLPPKFRQGLESGMEMKVGEVKLRWEADELTLYYEGEVEDEFFVKEIDDADMAVSLGLYYDSDSPQVCDTECYTMIKGAEFHEVSLVYHAGFPVATIEAVEAMVRNNGLKALKFSRTEDPLVEKKDLKEINWSE